MIKSTIKQLTTASGQVLKENIDVEVHRGELLLITGANGSGKSTLLQHLITHELNKTSYYYLPQLPRGEVLFPISLKEVIELGGEELNEYVPTLLGERQLSLRWNSASGGERKKALLLLGLQKKPELLILDEPFNHLDEQSIQQIINTFAKLLKNEFVRSIILVSHGDFLKTDLFAENLRELSL